jgi:NitT/TauT family transport system substrate-binding protein
MSRVGQISGVALMLSLASPLALGEEKLDQLKIAVGARGAYENQISEVGQEQGFFKKRGLQLEVLYTQGGGESLQAVISGSVDIGISIGTLGALGAYAKGAPIRVLANSMVGPYEFWYVRAESPIKTFKDAAGKTVAYSTKGSSTYLMVLTLEQQFGIKVEPTATGNPIATLTQVMSGQIDVGYTTPPLVLDALGAGKIRRIARSDDIPAMAKQTVRFVLANADALAKRPDVFRRYMQAYRDVIDWMYSDPGAIPAYAKWSGVSEEVAKWTRDDYVPKDRVNPNRVDGLEEMMSDAVAYKFLSAPLSAEQLKTLIQLQDPIK